MFQSPLGWHTFSSTLSKMFFFRKTIASKLINHIVFAAAFPIEHTLLISHTTTTARPTAPTTTATVDPMVSSDAVHTGPKREAPFGMTAARQILMQSIWFPPIAFSLKDMSSNSIEHVQSAYSSACCSYPCDGCHCHRRLALRVHPKPRPPDKVRYFLLTQCHSLQAPAPAWMPEPGSVYFGWLGDREYY